MIISVHIHKNAGMSFKNHLIKIFGSNLLLSYGRDNRVVERFFTKKNILKYIKSDFENITIVHGHFLSDLFDSFSKTNQYAIFLRDPVERVISNYYFFKRNHYKHSPICAMIAEGMSLEEYAMLNSSINVQSFFSANKSIEQFDYVGICEEYKKSVLLFDRVFNVKNSKKNTLNYYKKIIKSRFATKNELITSDSLINNKNPDKQTQSYNISEKIRNKIINLNLLDCEIYKQGTKHFKINCKRYNV